MRVMSSCIHLKGLRFHAFIGVGEQEQKVGNEYVVDLRLRYPFARAMESDDVADTLNYAEVFAVVKAVMAQPCRLLEHAAGNLARRLEESFPEISALDIELTKLNPPMGADCTGASVELHLINDKTKE
ncbi:dihydroneopterin aldolase [Prevotella dentasini]|uniref:dihydroneopterin aldolase n=1 Tax=Prevotella dentasini TaxID=589537 RepID=UPI000469BD86|nr:dihydroneopterin aldolase [Prevotella dentasini]